MCKCENEVTVKPDCDCSESVNNNCSDTITGASITGGVLGALAGGPAGLLLGAVLGAVGGALACDDQKK